MESNVSGADFGTHHRLNSSGLVHASKEALDAALGSYDGFDETIDQLEEVLATLAR